MIPIRVSLSASGLDCGLETDHNSSTALPRWEIDALLCLAYIIVL